MVEIIETGLMIGAASIKVTAAPIGIFLLIMLFTMGIVPQSHIGTIKPKRAAIIHDKKVFLGKILKSVSSEIHICIIEEIMLASKIKGKLSIIRLINVILNF